MMADSAPLADDQRKTGVGVKHRAFLHIRSLADPDRFVVTPQHGAKPDADILAQFDIADHMRIRAQ